MEWLKKLSAAIDYIENNLDGYISYDEAAGIACYIAQKHPMRIGGVRIPLVEDK